MVVLFYGVSTLFGSFNAELSQFDKGLHVSRSFFLQICMSTFFVYTQLNVKIVLFQTIQFSIRWQFSFIWPIDRTISGATTPGECGPGNDGNKGVLHIPQSSSITGTSLSDCLVPYLAQSLEEFYPSAEMQLVYSAAPVDWAKGKSDFILKCDWATWLSNRYIFLKTF